MHSPRAGSTPLVTFTVRPAPPATRSGPRMVWLPAAAMALSTAIAAGAGVVLGVLAATQVGPGRTQWLAVVQAHGAIQQWSWLAVFTAALVFEFIVRLNGRPAIPVGPRVATLTLIGGGAALAATGRLFDAPGELVVPLGTGATAAGTLLYLLIVVRVPPAHPRSVDWHPLYFRTGAVWLLVAALVAHAAAWRLSAGVVPLEDARLTSDLFLRGFIMNTTVAVGLRAFPGHLGLPHVTVRSQRWLWFLLNGGVLLSVAGSAALGLPRLTAAQAAGDLAFAAAIADATIVMRIASVARSWRRRPHRAQVLVPIAWAGAVIYAGVLAAYTLADQAGLTSTTIMEIGAVRHIFMLGFVAPLFLAMSHVVLDRFLLGHLRGENWLTASFVLLIVAWPMRAAPPLLGSRLGDAGEGVVGTAGVITAIALAIAAVVAATNAWSTAHYLRLAWRIATRPPSPPSPAGPGRGTGGGA